MKNPKIVVSKQESIAQDFFTKNDVPFELHIIVKMIPFTLRVAATDLDLRKTDISAKLYYDYDETDPKCVPKEVETLKVTPMEYVSHVDDNGKSLAMEIRVGVLTSSHEGAYFRVKVLAVERDREEPRTFECFSAPIKIMSKRSQIRKMLERKAVNPNAISNTSKANKMAPLPKTSSSKAAAASLKRKRAEVEELQDEDLSPASSIPESPRSEQNLAELLMRVQEQQREQAQLLRQVLMQQQMGGSPTPMLSALDASPMTPFAQPADLEQAFAAFIAVYQRAAPEERKSKMRKVLTQLDTTGSETVNEFVDLYASEGYYAPTPAPCSETDCPYKQQLEAFDSFYSEFMRDPLEMANSADLSSLLSQAKNLSKALKTKATE